MTIRELYYMSANMGEDTVIRVYEKGTLKWEGFYRELSAAYKERKVVVFDFDSDLSGCLITILPA